MKRLAKLLVLYLWFFTLAVPAQDIAGKHRKVFSAGTWSKAQLKYFDSGGAGTGGSGCSVTGVACTVTTTAVTAQSLLVCFSSFVGSATRTMSACTTTGGTETWTHCTTCTLTFNTTSGNLDVWYTLSAAGGDTAVTCNWSAAAAFYNSCGVFELPYTGPSKTFDIAGNATRTTCTSCAAVSLTLTGSNDAVIQLGAAGNTFTAITSGVFSTNAQFYGGFGQTVAFPLSGTTPAANWTQTSTAIGGVVAIAFKGN